MIKFETKRRIWSVAKCGFTWKLDVTDMRPDSWSLWWLWWSVEWISKEWIEYCERKGCSLADTFEFLVGEMMGETSDDLEGGGDVGSRP